ncbi:MAG: rhodanese-like domain-containing protein [Steroidobacteraceae bacterium]
MQRLLEYFANHPLLSGGAVALAIAVIVNEFLERARSFAAVSAAQAVQMMNQGALLLDVRGREAFAAGHIGEARAVETAELESSADSFNKWREKNVIVYCDSGMRSAAAARTLARLGFRQVFSLSGGLDGWRKDNLPVVTGAGKSGPSGPPKGLPKGPPKGQAKGGAR